MKSRIVILTIVGALIGAVAASGAWAVEFRQDLTYEAGEGFVDVLKDGKAVARYVYKDTPRPYIYPIHSPGGAVITRGYPVQTIPGEPTDHPHHRSFWIGFGDVNGIDFWTEGEKSGRIVQKSIDFDSLYPGYWNIHTINDWIGPEGELICQDERRYAFLSCEHGLLISTQLTIYPIYGEVKFGGTKEGFLAFRVAPGMQLKDGKGRILNSEGDTGNACWGKRARWCDYSGETNGKACGITIFDSPPNYGYPTYWHVRDYGLFAANPFGGKDFTGNEEDDSGLVIGSRFQKPGAPGSSAPANDDQERVSGHSETRSKSLKPVRFIYIALIHDGKLDADTLDAVADATVGRARTSVRRPAEPAQPAPAAPATR